MTKRPIARWYKARIEGLRQKNRPTEAVHRVRLSKKKIYVSLAILLVLIFSKYVYLASFSSYYTFYLIEKFGVTTQQSQLFLFAYLFAAAVGTLLGGPIGDRVGRKWVIWISILGTAPFALMLPHADLFWTCVLSVVIGLVLSSAFSAILVYAQEGRVDLGPLFWIGVRHRRDRGGRTGRHRGRAGDRIRLPDLRLDAPDRHRGRFSAQRQTPVVTKAGGSFWDLKNDRYLGLPKNFIP